MVNFSDNILQLKQNVLSLVSVSSYYEQHIQIFKKFESSRVYGHAIILVFFDSLTHELINEHDYLYKSRIHTLLSHHAL